MFLASIRSIFYLQRCARAWSSSMHALKTDSNRPLLRVWFTLQLLSELVQLCLEKLHPQAVGRGEGQRQYILFRNSARSLGVHIAYTEGTQNVSMCACIYLYTNLCMHAVRNIRYKNAFEFSTYTSMHTCSTIFLHTCSFQAYPTLTASVRRCMRVSYIASPQTNKRARRLHVSKYN